MYADDNLTGFEVLNGVHDPVDKAVMYERFVRNAAKSRTGQPHERYSSESMRVILNGIQAADLECTRLMQMKLPPEQRRTDHWAYSWCDVKVRAVMFQRRGGLNKMNGTLIRRACAKKI